MVENLLDERTNGIGTRRALAGRLHELSQRQTPESWLRTLKRYGAGAVPNEESAALIAEAFGLSREELPQAERLSLKSLELRLAVAEGKGLALETFAIERFHDLAEMLAKAEDSLTALKRAHDRLQARVRKLEAARHEHVEDAPRDPAAKAASR